MQINSVMGVRKQSETKVEYHKEFRFCVIKLRGVKRVFVVKNIPTLRIEYAKLKRALGAKRKQLKLFVSDMILRKPIYAYSFTRDCDMCERDFYSKFDSRKEYESHKEQMWEGAEGLTEVYRVSKELYLANDNYEGFRDRVQEAYENTGQGYYV